MRFAAILALVFTATALRLEKRGGSKKSEDSSADSTEKSGKKGGRKGKSTDASETTEKSAKNGTMEKTGKKESKMGEKSEDSTMEKSGERMKKMMENGTTTAWFYLPAGVASWKLISFNVTYLLKLIKQFHKQNVQIFFISLPFQDFFSTNVFWARL